MPSSRINLTTWPTAGPPACNQAKPDATTRPPAARQTPTNTRGDSCLRLPLAACQMANTMKTTTPASIDAIGTRNVLPMAQPTSRIIASMDSTLVASFAKSDCIAAWESRSSTASCA